MSGLPETPGTDVAGAVRDVVRGLPVGAVVTYGDVAAAVGISPRQAGRLIGQLSSQIPWWRVVYADGSAATCHGGSAVRLLRDEGVVLHRSRVDLARHRDASQPLRKNAFTERRSRVRGPAMSSKSGRAHTRHIVTAGRRGSFHPVMGAFVLYSSRGSSRS